VTSSAEVLVLVAAATVVAAARTVSYAGGGDSGLEHCSLAWSWQSTCVVCKFYNPVLSQQSSLRVRWGRVGSGLGRARSGRLPEI